MTSDIERCLQCRSLFLAAPLLRDELRHLIVRDGVSAARELLQERLGDQHAEHSR